MRDIALAMITVDRSPRPNYLPLTLVNMQRAGIFASSRFHSFHLADSGGSMGNVWPTPALVAADCIETARAVRGRDFRPHVHVYRTQVKRMACVNGAAALDAAVATGAPWVMFCEDDIDFCGDFLDSAGRWLDTYADGYHVFAFGANYPHVQIAAERLEFVWPYPQELFYGCQCLAFRRDDAASIADYWRGCPPVRGAGEDAIDIMITDWNRLAHPDQPNFLASAPSFIQHIGRVTYATKVAVTHQYPSWPGPFWAFEPGVVRA